MSIASEHPWTELYSILFLVMVAYWNICKSVSQINSIDISKVHIEDRACLLATKMKKENLEIYNVT